MASYTALYRRLRPVDFSSVVGQDHIIKTLSNQVKSNRISHAYLFCGTRGTGKTSTARVFARTINCENNKNGEKCGKCSFCLMSDEEVSPVIFEIDAASNNGVDNIRDIRDSVMYTPPFGKYKIYIIDEVHMLSAGAFNALLKTLEEPPEHVVFILATTEPQKLPATILSRCQRFDFKRISVKDIAETLRSYMDSDNIEADDEALKYIARVSGGAMRDALSILDQCIAFYFGERITLQKVLDVLGAVGNDILFSLADALRECDAKLCIKIISDAVEQGRDIGHFIADVTEHFRDLVVVSTLKENASLMDISTENLEACIQQSKKFNPDLLMAYINEFSELISKIKYSSNERILLEVTCIRLCNPSVKDDNGVLAARVGKIEAEMEKGFTPPKEVSSAERNPEKSSKNEDKPHKKISKAVPEDIKSVMKNWDNFVMGLGNDFIIGFLKNTKPGYIDGSFLYIVSANEGVCEVLKGKRDFISQKLLEKYNKTFDIVILDNSEYDIKHKEKFGVKDDFDIDSIINDINMPVKII